MAAEETPTHWRFQATTTTARRARIWCSNPKSLTARRSQGRTKQGNKSVPFLAPSPFWPRPLFGPFWPPFWPLLKFFVVDGLHRCGLSSSNAMELSSPRRADGRSNPAAESRESYAQARYDSPARKQPARPFPSFPAAPDKSPQTARPVASSSTRPPLQPPHRKHLCSMG